MSLIVKDRVLETCNSPGSGSITLLGSITGYQTFNAAVGIGNTCYYGIADQNGNNWEVGVGTLTSTSTLVRTTVLASSNGGVVTNFSSGIQNVFLTYPAERVVTTDTLAYPPPIGGTTPNSGAFTGLSATQDPEFTSTGSMLVPKGSTGQQPGSPVEGMLRYNTTDKQFEGYGGTPPSWNPVGNVAIVDDSTTATPTYPVVVKQVTGNTSVEYVSSAKYTYIPSTGELGATTFASKNFQVGTSGTAGNNFTWYQPNIPDGTIRLGNGNSGATTSDLIEVSASGVTLNDTTDVDTLNVNTVLNLTQWTTGTRPSPATAGMTGYNTSTGQTETYNGTVWVTAGGLVQQPIQTSNFTAAVGCSYPVNTSAGTVTVFLPASAVAGQQVNVFDYAGTANINKIILNPNGSRINSTSVNSYMTQLRESVTFTYVDTVQGWLVLSDGFGTNVPSLFSAFYLVVAGGGGGGSQVPSLNNGGGGGGGGVVSNVLTITAGATYTFIVGAGGAGDSNGGNSTFAGVVTCIGGGAGGGLGRNPGSSGGCGGGGTAPTGTAGGSGTSGQGYAGGVGGTVGTNSSGFVGGGGGGAGGGGAAGNSGGTGGVGAYSSITGSYYGGGGGGGANTGAGAGGAGGGGYGGNGYPPSLPAAGGIQTGGGGGGTGGNSYSGAAGGSGVIFFVVPTVYFTNIVTGAPTIYTIGPDTVMKFTSSGSYSA